MELFERGKRQRVLVTTVCIVLVLAIFGVGLLVFDQASQMSSAKGATETVVTLGSLSLMRITKTPLTDGGFTVGIETLDGMFFYAAGWLLIGALTILARLRLAVDRA